MIEFNKPVKNMQGELVHNIKETVHVKKGVKDVSMTITQKNGAKVEVQLNH